MDCARFAVARAARRGGEEVGVSGAGRGRIACAALLDRVAAGRWVAACGAG